MNNNWRKGALFALLFASLFITGCVNLRDPETSQEHRPDIVGVADSHQTFGQSFLSRRPRFNGIELWLIIPEESSEIEHGTVYIDLYHDPTQSELLASATTSFAAIRENPSIKIAFPTQHDPPNQGYFIHVRSPDGVIKALGRNENIYVSGYLYQDDQAQSADLGFRTTYDYDIRAAKQDLFTFLKQAWLIVPLLITTWLPGRLLLSIASPISDISQADKSSPHPKIEMESYDFSDRMALSIGLSLAIIPIILLWTTTIGVEWGRGSAILAGILLLALAVYRLGQNLKTTSIRERLANIRIKASDVALIAVFMITLFTRFAMVRDLSAPAWVDPVHHATITQLIVDQGKLPQNYQPYLDNQIAGYHPGYHSLQAFFQWLSGLEIHSGMLYFSQILNALIIFAVYLFTTVMVKNRWAGVFAALLTGLYSPMPAYYASWGRFTQLAGLLILPAALALIRRAVAVRINKNTWNKGLAGNFTLIVLAAIACAGLAITHYRVITFFAALAIAMMIVDMLRSLYLKRNIMLFKTDLFVFILTAIIAILFTLPWWLDRIPNFILPFSNMMSAATQRPPFFEGFYWPLITAAQGKAVLALGGFGLIWAIISKRWFWLCLALWIGFLFITSNFSALGIPSLNFINNLSVEITLFMPLSAIGGYFLADILHKTNRIIPKRVKLPFHGSIIVFLFIFTFIAVKSLLPLLNPITMLFREADYPAILWIKENIPKSETILVNPFLWGYGVYAGQDGGAWITPIAGRKTMPPPVLYLVDKQIDTGLEIIDTTRHILDVQKNSASLHAYIKEKGIRFVYLGARGGAFSPHDLNESPLFELLFNQDGVWLFEVR